MSERKAWHAEDVEVGDLVWYRMGEHAVPCIVTARQPWGFSLLEDPTESE